MRAKREYSGFTLIELMIVASIVGLLSAIAIPKFANMIVKAKEAAIKGDLGSIRSAVAIYYADNEGVNPNPNFGLPDGGLQLGYILIPKYLNEIRSHEIPTVGVHTLFGLTRRVQQGGSRWVNPAVFGEWCGADSCTTWGYHPPSGVLVVMCTHLDSRGVLWSTY